MKKMEQTTILADSFYTIANAQGKVIEAAAAEKNGAAICLSSAVKASENQQWAFIRMGEGVYRIQNRATGKVMDLMMGGKADGTWLHQWDDVSGSSQLWIIEAGNDGTVKIKSQLAPTKCVDVAGISNEDGAQIQIWEDVNGENQKWTITEVKPAKKAAAKKEEKPAEEAKPAEEKKPAKKAAAKKTTAKKEEKPAEAPKAEEVKAEPVKAEEPKTEEVKAEAAAPAEEKKPAKKAPAKKAAAKKPAKKAKKAKK